MAAPNDILPGTVNTKNSDTLRLESLDTVRIGPYCLGDGPGFYAAGSCPYPIHHVWVSPGSDWDSSQAKYATILPVGDGKLTAVFRALYANYKDNEVGGLSVNNSCISLLGVKPSVR